SLHDGTKVITLSKDGTLHGAEAFPQKYQLMAKAALQQQQPTIPEWVKELHGHEGTLMGQSEGNPIQLSMPLGVVVDSTKPQFEWKPLRGANHYSIKVFDSNFHPVLSSDPIEETHWIPNSDLERGSIYTWKVTAFTDHGEVFSPVPPAPEA